MQDLEAEQLGVASLAEGLSGVAPAAQSQLPSLPGWAHEASALREAPYASLGPLVTHLQEVVHGVINAVQQGGTNGHGEGAPAAAAAGADRVRSLCFAISSTVGSSRLSAQDEAQLWGITQALWVSFTLTRLLSLRSQPSGSPFPRISLFLSPAQDASMEASSSAHDPAAAAPASDLLHDLGSDIFQVVQGNCDPAHLDVATYIRHLCKAGKTWARLGRADRAAWCVGHAVRHAERLEALMASDDLRQDAREACVVQLFELYLQAAQNSAASQQQSVANNMLVRALNLSKHEAVGPAAQASMSLSIAELQLVQAQEMMGDAATAATAAVLLQSAQQHLDGAGAAAAAAGGADSSGLLGTVRQASTRVATAAAEAHLLLGNAAAALQWLEKLKQQPAEGGGFSAVEALVVRARLAAGDVSLAAQQLGMLSGDIILEGSALDAWLDAFELVLDAASGSDAVSSALLLNAALGYIHAVRTEPQNLLLLLRRLLHSSSAGSTRGSDTQWQEIVLRILAADDIVAAVCKVRDS